MQELQKLERDCTWKKHKIKVEQMYMKARMDVNYDELTGGDTRDRKSKGAM